MGRKGGGGKAWTLSSAIMKQRIDACTIKDPSFENIVDHLRSTHLEYKRCKLIPFFAKVQQVLDNRPRNPPQNDGVEEEKSPGKNRWEMDDDEREIDPVRKRRREYDHDHHRVGLASSSSASGSTSDSEVDLMKNMLRVGYGGVSKPEKVGKEENLEVDDVSKVKEVASLMAMGREDGDGGEKNNNTSEYVKGLGRCSTTNQGPMFKDLGGIEAVLNQLKKEFIVPLYHPQILQCLGIKPIAGILLHGPPGCGKTKLAHAIANEARVPFYQISATELVSAVSGASEKNIRDLFSKAYRTAPSIVFIDEIDAIASKRENLQREMERRIVTQLLTCMDESHRPLQPHDKNSDSEAADSKAADKRTGYVLVIGATNRPDAIDPALRRPGRLDREISLGVPDQNARLEILSVITQNLKLAGDIDMMKIAKATPGFVGADLSALANKAGNLAMQRIMEERKLEMSKKGGEHDEEWWREPWSPEEMEKLSIIMSDFEEAAKMVQPSLRREGFSAIPDVTWDDVGGLDVLRKEFDRLVVRRIKYPELCENSGLDMETGILLYGPPGCGKTLIAKAVANEAGANFIHIKGPELLNKYVGESELHVRMIFSRARTCAPCILFFDEVDALTTKRGKEGGWVVERLVNQLLIELDGADKRRGVYVIGATNRPEVMDVALLRPGRFGRLLFVPLPSPDERGLILKALVRKKPIGASVDLHALGKSPSCEDLSGADLAALVQEAAMAALDEKLAAFEDKMEPAESLSDSTLLTIESAHFAQARRRISRSVSAEQKQYYQALLTQFSSSVKSVPQPQLGFQGLPNGYCKANLIGEDSK